jgi:hypothetical protein
MAETPPIAPGQLAPSSSQTVTIAVTKEDAVKLKFTVFFSHLMVLTLAHRISPVMTEQKILLS